MATIKYEGHDFEYDETIVNSYAAQKAFAQVRERPEKFFDVLEKLFLGHDEEYSEVLGGSLEEMAKLYMAVVEQEGDSAKN